MFSGLAMISRQSAQIPPPPTPYALPYCTKLISSIAATALLDLLDLLASHSLWGKSDPRVCPWGLNRSEGSDEFQRTIVARELQSDVLQSNKSADWKISVTAVQIYARRSSIL